MSGCLCFDCVHEMDAGVVESCGKFNRVVPAGCVILMCPCERIVARVPLRINYMEVQCDTKTKDNVFVRVVVAGLNNFSFINIYICNLLCQFVFAFSSIPRAGRQGSQRLLQAHR